MIKKCTLILAMIPFVASLQAGIWDNIKSVFVAPEKPKPPMIKVLIAHDVESAQLEVKGKHSIYDPYKHEHLSTHFQNKIGHVQTVPSGIKWGEEFPGVYQVKIVPETRSSIIYVDGVPYKGSIVVYDVGGNISIVNEVEIEEYLRSTMSSKASDVTSDEALAAVTIAQRTRAFYLAMSSSNPYWHVDAANVGYYGYKSDPCDSRLLDAIASTRYMVISQTGSVYEGVITPIAVDVVYGQSKDKKGRQRVLATSEAESLAQKGENAAKILNRTFPNTSLELSYNPGSSSTGSKHIAEAHTHHHSHEMR